MSFHQSEISVATRGQGTYEITEWCESAVREAGFRTGLLHVFCRHTSCSLVLMENADPSARRDLERWLGRLVPVDDADFTHTLEGPDDMPSHIKMALTRTGETIPIVDGRLGMGTWQGVFLWEHRSMPHTRSLIATVIGE